MVAIVLWWYYGVVSFVMCWFVVVDAVDSLINRAEHASDPCKQGLTWRNVDVVHTRLVQSIGLKGYIRRVLSVGMYERD